MWFPQVRLGPVRLPGEGMWGTPVSPLAQGAMKGFLSITDGHLLRKVPTCMQPPELRPFRNPQGGGGRWCGPGLSHGARQVPVIAVPVGVPTAASTSPSTENPLFRVFKQFVLAFFNIIPR